MPPLFSKHLYGQFSKRFHGGVDIVVSLMLLWGISVGLDRIWLALDQSVPSWDPADHLIGALNYSWMVQNASWLSAEWWHGIWTLSSKYPPLLYLSTAPFVLLFGQSADAAIWVNGFYTAILLVSVYGLGRHLFNPTVGLWAAVLCVLFPQFYTLRSQYFMDYPLTALVAASFCFLTYWKDSRGRQYQWLLAIAFGFTFGVASLMKQTAVLFLGIPLLVLGLRSLWQKQWGRLIQLVIGSTITGLMMLPWSRTNWLFQISAAFTANTRSAAIEGDPSALSIEGWTYYVSHLPQAISYPLLTMAVLGLLLWWVGVFPQGSQARSIAEKASHHVSRWGHNLGWLAIFLGGTYVVWSAIANKDVRYIMPYLPVIAVILGLGMACWQGRWRVVPWAAVGLSVVLMGANLFSTVNVSGSAQDAHRSLAIAKRLTPAGQHFVYQGNTWPHADIVAEMVRTQPYQIMNVGVLPSTPEINQHNLNYFGTQADFQVYARRMGKSQEHIDQDLRSLSWVVSVTRPQLNHHDRKSRRRQLAISQDLRRSPNFKRQRSWDLPDGSRLDLFRRRQLPIEVTPLETEEPIASGIQLARTSLPERALAGQAIPVTYAWRGSWDALSHGSVLLTWHQQGKGSEPLNAQWLHDHSIGLGTLRPQPIQANQSVRAPVPFVESEHPFEVIERISMKPPDEIEPGTYSLKALYLNTATGETSSLAVPSMTITIESLVLPTEISDASRNDASRNDVSATELSDDELAETDRSNRGTLGLEVPEVDWVSQLRNLSTALPQGIDSLDPVFDQIGRFSLYDPIQSYAVQAETTLTYRLQHNPDNLNYAYALTLAQVLQRDATGAIATLNDIAILDADNPYAHAYLAFVNLYALHPRAAQQAINQAITLMPDSQTFKSLRAVASLMRGDLWQTWRDGWEVLKED